MIVSLSGMDNSGKSTQAQRLLKNYPNLVISKLHINDTQSFDKAKYNFEWWFSPCNGEEFVKAIYTCIQERNELAKKLDRDGKIIIFDKGNDFYDIRVLATLIAKGYTYNDAKMLRDSIKKQFNIEDIETMKFYLLPGSYHRENEKLPNMQLYNSYLEINKMLLKLEELDYEYIEPDEIDKVTNNILSKIMYRMEGLNEKTYIRQDARNIF